MRLKEWRFGTVTSSRKMVYQERMGRMYRHIAGSVGLPFSHRVARDEVYIVACCGKRGIDGLRHH